MALVDDQGKITTHHTGTIAVITIRNPKRRNAVSLAMWQDLVDHVKQADKTPSVNLICLQGEGGTFVSGADISEFAANRSDARQAKAYARANDAAFASLREAETPTLACIQGACFGGGVGLAAACDLRLASSDARFAIPAAKLGLAYPFEALQDLVALIGPSSAKHLIFLGNPINADEAKGIGLVDILVPADSFSQRQDQIAQTLVSRAPLTLRAAKQSIAAIAAGKDETAVRHALDACFDSQDYQEGWQAFLDKRPAKFEGR